MFRRGHWRYIMSQHLHKIIPGMYSRVPDHAPVLDSDLLIAVVYARHFLHAIIQRLLRPA